MSNAEQKRIVVVDGYSTARDLLPELLERDVECIHLQSTARIPAPAAGSFTATFYDGNLGYVGDADAAIAVLGELRPDAVIAGSEWGVTFAEQIAHRMGLPTNRIETFNARRDKFNMIEAVRRHGLHAAEQTRASTAAAARAWADRQGEWPIVVKPLASAGSDGVSICRSPADIDAAFANELGRENFMGCRNERMLLQTYLSGPQFIVNAVSWNGRHYITDAWSQAATMRGSAVVPHDINLLDPSATRTQALMHYTLAVLDALGIENGASHSELKWTPDGPALVETGARLMGAAMDRPSYRFADIESQAMVYAQVLAGHAPEADALFAQGHYRRKRHMTMVLFNFRDAGVVRSTEGLIRLRELRSFHAHYRPLAKGSRIWKTADWLCCGGVVYLVHDDPDQIASDIETFRAWEKRGELYGVRSADALVGA